MNVARPAPSLEMARTHIFTKTQTIQAAILALLRSRKGYTNADLARKLKLPYRTVQRNTLALNRIDRIIGIWIPKIDAGRWYLAEAARCKT